jgi:HTH-type transcriptional regulator/antitoxin HipB
MNPHSNSKKNREIPIRSAEQMGQAIERYRGLAESNQRELAKRAGIRQATVSKVEQGAPHTEIETIFAICGALDLELVIRPRSKTAKEFDPKELF